MKNLVIDSDAVFQMIKHTVLSDLTHDGIEVGIIFGFMRQIQVIAHQYLPNNIAFCWDSRENLRKKVNPQYKATRKKEELDPKITKAIYWQKAILEEELPKIGFINQFRIDGYESDDLIASLVQSNEEDDWIIASHDNDLFQLLSSKVAIHNIQKKRAYTKAMFMKEYGIEPKDWAQVKAMAGCKSDNVDGIDGVGETTAIKAITKTLSPKAKIFHTIHSPVSEALIDNNYILVRLPFVGTPPLTLTQSRIDLSVLFAFFDKFSFRSLLEDSSIERWRNIGNHINFV